MMKMVHRYDDTRPITSAMNAGYLTDAGDAYVEDIIGVNYSTNRYDAIHKHHPDKPMFGSEDTNEKTTRGEYADVPATGMRSAYNLSVDGWQAVITRPFMAGSFTWTGFDYKGEPNPYGWPDISNNTGLLDVCGFPKDKAYYFQSCWIDKPMVHLMPSSWNAVAKEGEKCGSLRSATRSRLSFSSMDRVWVARDAARWRARMASAVQERRARGESIYRRESCRDRRTSDHRPRGASKYKSIERRFTPTARMRWWRRFPSWTRKAGSCLTRPITSDSNSPVAERFSVSATAILPITRPPKPVSERASTAVASR